jgi:hypothetical protein
MTSIFSITLEKANVVADALSRKSQANMLVAHLMPQELCW